LAAQQVVDGDVEDLADGVEAGELERGMDLRAVVVERSGGIEDLEPQRGRVEDVVSEKLRPKRLDGQLGALTPATHLAEPDDAALRFNLDDRPDEAAPVGSGGMA